MTEHHQIIGFPLRAREHEQRDILTVHAIHHMRHESIAIQGIDARQSAAHHRPLKKGT